MLSRHGGLEPDSQRASDLVMQLLAIPGRSGEEQGVAAFLSGQLKRAGVPARAVLTDTAHRRSPFGGQIGNLIVKLRGTMRAPRRLFTAHMDTVPICVGCRPVRKGRIVRSANPETGLGADDRGGCAVLLNTVLEILQHQLPHPPLTFCWLVQEEVGLKGSQQLRASLLGNPRMGFNFDGGSAARITVGATGGYRMNIEIHGRASHAGALPNTASVPLPWRRWQSLTCTVEAGTATYARTGGMGPAILASLPEGKPPMSWRIT